MADNHSCIARDNAGSILDTNGEPLYLVDYNGLLCEIVERNDVPNLNCYIQQLPKNVLRHDGIIQCDPFWVAAEHGSTDALRVLLDLYEADPSQTQPLNKDARGFWLLETACEHGQLETARFLLDRDPPLGAAYTERRDGGIALLSAGMSLARAGTFEFEKRNRNRHDEHFLLCDRIARSEELIRLLLDRGASIENAVQMLYWARHEKEARLVLPPDQQRIQSVLGQVVSRGSYELVSRVITESADIHKRQELGYNDTIQSASPLHIASSFWNLAGIQALFDRSVGSRAELAEMVSVRDRNGRLPLHWAAAGAEMGDETSDEYFISDGDLTSRIIGTLKLLIENNPDTINSRDDQSWTALHHLVHEHRICGGKRHLEEAVRFLCENGLDAGLCNDKGETALHELGVSHNPTSAVVLEIMMIHGASTTINHISSYGMSALHRIARNLKQVEAVRVLISHGADINALTQKGNTPLHEAAVGNYAPTVLIEKGEGPEHVYPTLMDKIKAQDEMLSILQKAGCSMDQPNGEGKTPQQLLEETRANWRRIKESKGKPRTRGRGRGRG